VGYLTFPPAALSEEGLLNNRVFLLDSTPSEEIRRGSKGVLAAGAIWNSLMKRRAGDGFARNLWQVMQDMDDVLIYGYQRAFTTNPGLLTLVNGLEQAPNPDSRVTLSAELDALGVPLANLDWRLGALEKKTMIRANELVGLAAGRAGIGRVKLIKPQEDTGWPAGIRGGWHQMGTTRMDTNRKAGVVDENCRVHGTANLFVAGSSVFPTGGYTNPTLTIVALALRLADYLKSRTGLI
jgi:choline dehydrogenase-like flavoprotein